MSKDMRQDFKIVRMTSGGQIYAFIQVDGVCHDDDDLDGAEWDEAKEALYKALKGDLMVLPIATDAGGTPLSSEDGPHNRL